MIRAIIFDYGNVISRFDHMLFFKRMLPFSSLSIPEIQAEARREPNLVVSYETGEITSAEFTEQVIRRLRLSIAEDEFKAAFVNIFERIPSTIQLIRSLKPAYQLGLLSNTNEWHYETEMLTLDVFPLFDSVTLSFRVGAMKPDKRLYLDALHQLRLEPHECIYIDDIAAYVEAAGAMGFQAIHYVGHEALMTALRQLGISADGGAFPKPSMNH